MQIRALGSKSRVTSKRDATAGTKVEYSWLGHDRRTTNTLISGVRITPPNRNFDVYIPSGIDSTCIAQRLTVTEIQFSPYSLWR